MSFIRKIGEIPSAFAASTCPLSTDSIPALIISETYAPEFREKAITPAEKTLSLRPIKPGNPKYIIVN